MMESGRTAIQQQLDRLRAATSSDFAGLAWFVPQEHRIRWLLASGNLGERYRNLALKPGRGLSGQVIRLGRPVVLDDSAPEAEVERLRHEYSILMVEQLHSFLAVPVAADGETRGALLIGSRQPRRFAPSDLPAATEAAERIAEAMPSFACESTHK
ncbi:MAG: GAF domain-containing protein [Paenibacillaceae bacterium]|nr:GAF domain-containing protein [Paenibacillaceae bacterium]